MKKAAEAEGYMHKDPATENEYVAVDLEAGTRKNITDGYIETAITKAERWVRQKASERLRPHERVLYDALKDHKVAGMELLHDEYRDRVDELGLGRPRTERTCRRYFEKMADYHLVRLTGSTSDRTYHIVDAPAELWKPVEIPYQQIGIAYEVEHNCFIQ